MVASQETSFKELCEGKPSKAIRGMLAGLQDAEAREDFVVSMDTFGLIVDDVCYGCAATCAVMKLANVQLKAEQFKVEKHQRQIGGQMAPSRRAELCHVTRDDLYAFEVAINNFRLGSVIHLLEYFGYDPWDARSRFAPFTDDRDWKMTDNWRAAEPAILAFVEQLEAAGL